MAAAGSPHLIAVSRARSPPLFLLGRPSSPPAGDGHYRPGLGRSGNFFAGSGDPWLIRQRPRPVVPPLPSLSDGAAGDGAATCGFGPPVLGSGDIPWGFSHGTIGGPPHWPTAIQGGTSGHLVVARWQRAQASPTLASRHCLLYLGMHPAMGVPWDSCWCAHGEIQVRPQAGRHR